MQHFSYRSGNVKNLKHVFIAMFPHFEDKLFLSLGEKCGNMYSYTVILFRILASHLFPDIWDFFSNTYRDNKSHFWIGNVSVIRR